MIAFIAMMVLSLLWWFVLRQFVVTENNENREMAERPVFTISGYPEFSGKYTEYFNDNLPLRNTLIRINNGLDYFLFKRSANEDVIIGEDGWLFYNKQSDGAPMDNYLGNDLLSDDELQTLVANCVAQRDYLKERGREFVIFIAPNKERIYSAQMPSLYGSPAEHYRALQICEYLKQHTDLRVVYPYAELTEARDRLSENIYYKTDTHWNYIGGYVGASALMRELGVDMPDITDVTVTDTGDASGDLADMLGLGGLLRSGDREYTVSGYDTHNVQSDEWDFWGSLVYSAENADPRSIYVIRDSFCTHMAPYIASQFSSSSMRHVDAYSADDMEEYDPDIVVFETVERYAYKLMDFSIGRK